MEPPQINSHDESSAGTQIDFPQEKSLATQIDFYQLLNVPRDATLEMIKKQYRKLSLLYHPDKKIGNELKFAQINLAFKVLSNEKKRNKYDSALAGTFEELTSVDRDVKYHRNEEFIKTDYAGKQVFDEDKFLAEFRRNNQTLDADFQSPSENIKDLADRRYQERQYLVDDLINNTKMTASTINSMSGRDFNDKFNLAFEDLKKRNKELVECSEKSATCDEPEGLATNIGNTYGTSTGMILDGEHLDLSAPGFQSKTVEESFRQTHKSLEKTSDDWKRPADTDDLMARIAAYRQESEQIKDYRDDDFKINHNPELLSFEEAEAESEEE